MYNNHSIHNFYNANVNPVHVWSQGLIADGKMDIVRISITIKE